jgi:hypothetical protein
VDRVASVGVLSECFLFPTHCYPITRPGFKMPPKPKPVKHVCPVCMKGVFDDEKGIQCSLTCKRWFHPGCICMSDEEYDKHARNDRLKWNCLRADCLPQDMQPTQVLMKKMDDFADTLSTILSRVNELQSLPSKVDQLQADVASINSKLSSIEDRLSASEANIAKSSSRIDAIESSLVDLRSCSSNAQQMSYEGIIQEFNDRNWRASNIIIHGLPEFAGRGDSGGIKTREKERISKIINVFLKDFNTNSVRLFRLGTPRKEEPRPLKVVFPSALDARKFASSFSADALRDIDESLASITISRDRTKRERDYLKKLYDELNERKRKGDNNLEIKYINGVPIIRESSSKNGQTPSGDKKT